MAMKWMRLNAWIAPQKRGFTTFDHLHMELCNVDEVIHIRSPNRVLIFPFRKEVLLQYTSHPSTGAHSHQPKVHAYTQLSHFFGLISLS